MLPPPYRCSRGIVAHGRKVLISGTRRGIAVDLKPRGSQTGNAIPIQIALPRHELIDGEAVTAG